MNGEPTWKTVLNWGVVILFLTLPLIIMTIQLYILVHPTWMPAAGQYREHFNYLKDFMNTLAMLVFGLSGLRTWETIKHNGYHDEPGNSVHLRPGPDAERLRRGERDPAPDPGGAEKP